MCFFEDPETEQERIVVIYNARNAPPVVTMDINDTQSLVTLKADDAPLAIMSCHSTKVPSGATLYWSPAMVLKTLSALQIVQHVFQQTPKHLL